jgi:CheY-like chemotaxis protein
MSTLPQGNSASLSPVVRTLDILIVDDDPDTLTTLSMLLQLNGCEVRAAETGVVALTMHEQRRPDVILLDIGLPYMDGFEVCRRIRELPGGKTPLIIAITGFADDIYRDQAAQAGIDLYLLKPVPFPTLEGILSRFRRVMQLSNKVATSDTIPTTETRIKPP